MKSMAMITTEDERITTWLDYEANRTQEDKWNYAQSMVKRRMRRNDDDGNDDDNYDGNDDDDLFNSPLLEIV